MSDYHRHIKNLKKWKDARAFVFERDDYTCVECGATADEAPLHADHDPVPLVALFANGVTPEAIDLACDPDGLVTRCERCNTHKGTGTATTRTTFVSPRYPTLRGLIEGAFL